MRAEFIKQRRAKRHFACTASVHLKREQSTHRRVIPLRARHAVDLRANARTNAFDVVVIPRTKLERLPRRFILAQRRKPRTTALFIDAT